MNICENYGMLLDTQSTVANLCQGRRNGGKAGGLVTPPDLFEYIPTGGRGRQCSPNQYPPFPDLKTFLRTCLSMFRRHEAVIRKSLKISPADFPI